MSSPTPTTPAVFLSYAREDSEVARSIAAALRASGVEVWFDQNELVGGDAWDAKIRKQISECALFIPVISANTNARGEGYFRLEWKLAVDRSHLMAHDQPFLLPVVVDETSDAAARVPTEFRAVQWTRLSGGETPEKFCARVKQLLGRESVAGVAAPGPASARPATTRDEVYPPLAAPEATRGVASPLRQKPKAGRRVPVAAWVISAVAVLAVAALLWQRRSETSSPVSAGAGTRAPTAEKSPAAPAASDKSIVVLPFENLSPDPENALFTEGMHTEIISNLQLLSDLKVISRGRALAFKGSPASNAEIAQKLGVAHVITGSVGRGKDRVRITLELRRASDDALLWSLPKRDYDLKDALALQSDIAEQVGRVLQAREVKGGSIALAQFMTKDPRAYDLFLKARKAADEGDGSNHREEIAARCEAILALDPDFMLAAQLLSGSRCTLAVAATDPVERVRQATEAKRWAAAAARMVPGGAGDGALAYYYASVERDGVRSLAYAENMIRALPNSAQAHNYAGIALSNLGRRAEAVAAMRHACELDPLSHIFEASQSRSLAASRRSVEWRQMLANYVAKGGRADTPRFIDDRFVLAGEIPAALERMSAPQRVTWLWLGRRFAEALALTTAGLHNDQIDDVQRWSFLCTQADIHARLGQPAESTAAAREAVAVAERLQSVPEVGPTAKPGWLAAALVRNGRNEEAIAAAKRAVDAASPESQMSLRWTREIALAKIYAYAKRPREGVELLAKLLRVPSGITVPMLKVEPDWDNVREDAAFKALLADPKNSAPL